MTNADQLARDRHWLQRTIELSQRCPLSATAFSVGSLIVGADGDVIADGYSRETDAAVHAEEAALAKVSPGDLRLAAATIYSSLEPCSVRKSRPRSCTTLIREARIGRVVFAWREPAVFVDCQGVEELLNAGVAVVEIPELAEQVRAVNSHLWR